MSNQPLVSIAICTYNGAKYLIEQLESIVNQTYSNIEIIAVDDKSYDNTVEILKSYAGAYSNVKLYENEVNLGYIKNFEKALGLCSGEFIALCDQDDIWDLRKIDILLQEISQNILIYHDSAFIDGDGRPMNNNLSNVINMYEGDSFKPFLVSNSISGHACFFERKLLKYCLPFPTGIFHDRWISYVAGNVGKMRYLNQTLVQYRQHEKSDTNILKLKRANNENILYGKIKIENTVKELEIFNTYPLNKEPHFVSKFLELNKTRLTNYFCLRLIIFMYANYKSLLFISKKGTFSKLNFIFKHLWGSKLRKT